MTAVCLKIEFETAKFALTGPLPEDANAGNQLYGEDVAQWICATLSEWNFDYLDEDWGWYVLAGGGPSPPDEKHWIGVGAFPAENQTDNHGEWRLMLHADRKLPWLLFFSRWKPAHFNTRLGVDLLNAVRALGVQNLRASVVRMDAAGNEIGESQFDG